ncbi:unnamed protein product [Diatraea saccharalis]|uniref:Uncharacterized protein n=1 Tax=Diatraea saccharalis TaxID=40085 RepID=A0A9N9WIZ2_9NEOP|nr:unnamed protein product [Diatraea saccharalis]
MKARSQRPERNDIDLFFGSVAETVKKFPRLEQVRLKFSIMNMVHEVEMKMCLESDGASSSTPPHYNHNTFSPSPSSQSFDIHNSLFPPVTEPLSFTTIAYSSPSVTQQVSSPHYVHESSPSPQIAYSSPPVTQQVPSPQYLHESSPSPQIAYSLSSPVTQQDPSPQYVHESSPSPQIAYCPPPPVSQHIPFSQYLPHSSPSPQITNSLPSPVTQKVSSSQFILQSTASPQMAYRIASSPSIQPSKSTKKRKNTLLLQEYGFEHIKNAFVQGLRALGEYEEAHLVEELRNADTQKKFDLRNMWNNLDQMKTLSDEEALSAFIDLDLTKAQYMYLKNLTNERKCCIFPPFYKIQEIKKILLSTIINSGNYKYLC